MTNFLNGGTEVEDKDIDSIDKDANKQKVGPARPRPNSHFLKTAF